MDIAVAKFARDAFEKEAKKEKFTALKEITGTSDYSQSVFMDSLKNAVKVLNEQGDDEG